MATCHSLRVVDDELIGDPLDLKMFEFTGWSYEEGKHNATEVGSENESLSPSVARPPPNFASYNDYGEESVSSHPIVTLGSSANEIPTDGTI